jgi:hypothetical protein
VFTQKFGNGRIPDFLDIPARFNRQQRNQGLQIALGVAHVGAALHHGACTGVHRDDQSTVQPNAVTVWNGVMGIHDKFIPEQGFHERKRFAVEELAEAHLTHDLVACCFHESFSVKV